MSAHKPLRPPLGSAIRNVRRALDITQVELSERMGVSSCYVSMVEAGNRECSMRFLRDAARSLHVRASVLLARAEEIEEGRQ